MEQNVLIVDDSLINRELLQYILQDRYQVYQAENGAQAIEMIQSRERIYRLMLLDIQMPVMDGYEAAAAIRASATPYTLSLPIVAMTANAFAEDVILAKKSGMNEHLAKPIDISQLYAVMKRWLAA